MIFHPDTPEFAAAMTAATETFRQTDAKARELGATLTAGLEPPLVSIAKQAQQAIDDFQDSLSSVRATPPAGHIAEETWERCPCVSPLEGGVRWYAPKADCSFCEGTGWWATKRIIRPLPKPDFNEQAALAQLKTKDTHLRMAAKTIEAAADLLERAGKAKDAAQTRQAAQAVRDTVEGAG